MSLSQNQYAALLAQLDSNIEQAEAQLKHLKNQRQVSRLFAELQEIPTGELLLLGQESPIFSLIESSPTFFKVTASGETEVQVTRRDGQLSVVTSEQQRCYLQDHELEQLTQSATWDQDTCTVKVQARQIGRVWTYISEAPVVSVANLAEAPQFTVMPSQSFTLSVGQQ